MFEKKKGAHMTTPTNKKGLKQIWVPKTKNWSILQAICEKRQYKAHDKNVIHAHIWRHISAFSRKAFKRGSRREVVLQVYIIIQKIYNEEMNS